MNTLTHLLQQNPAVDFAALDLRDPDALAAISFLPDVDRADQLAWLAGYRRLLRLTEDRQTALALFLRGLHSVFQITERARTRFVREYGADCGGPGPAARIYDRAVARKSQVVQTFAAVQQAGAAYYRAGRFDNLSAAVGANFNGVPGYDELFGNLDYCTCPECRTIFSPAAYFVDLMRMQAKYIEFVGNEDAAQQLALESRRPDLWGIPLDCANTNTLVPTIEVVNKVLIASVTAADETAGADTQDVASATADEPETDTTAALYQELNEAVYPAALPFNRPLDEISTILARENTDLARVWERITPAAQRKNDDWKKGMNLARMGLSPQRWRICSSGFNSDYPLWKAYGYRTSKKAADIVKDFADMNVLLERTGLSIAGLRELVYEDLTEAQWTAQAKSFYINKPKDDTEPIELDFENGTVKNLTSDRVARITMFLRLSDSLGWSFSELDWALVANGRRDGMTVARSTANSRTFLGWLAAMRKARPQWSIEELCAMQGILKNYAAKSTVSFQDRIFFNANVPNARLLHDYLQDNKSWQVPALDPNDDANTDDDSMKLQAALAGALALSVDELLFFANSLVPYQLKADDIEDVEYWGDDEEPEDRESEPDQSPERRPTAPPATSSPAQVRRFQADDPPANALCINAENLAVLYRCSRLGRLSGLTLPEVFTALALPGAPADALQEIFTPIIAQDARKTANKKVQPLLEWLVAYGDWIRESPLSTFELEYLLTGTSKQPRIRNRMLGPDALKNFHETFQESIADSLLNPEKFAGALGDTAGFNQFNEQDQATVYSALQSGGYINQLNHVVTVPSETEMADIVVKIFPDDTPPTDPVVSSLSAALVDYLTRPRKDTDATDPAAVSDTGKLWLPEKKFKRQTRTIFVDAMSSDYLPALLWDKIVAEHVSDGIVSIELRAADADTLANLRKSIAPLLFQGQRATEDDENFLAELTEAVASTLIGALEIQQLTFARELAALYGISPGQFTPLLITLPVYQPSADEDEYVPLRLADLNGEWTERLSAALSAFQPYVLLTTNLDLSAADLVAIAANPAAFDIAVSSPAASPNLLNADNVRVLVAFKALQREWGDTQNRLTGYLAAVKAQGTDATPDTAAPLLSDITGWNEKQILFLIDKLWPDDKAAPPAYATVAGLDLLARWFAECARLDLDASTLDQLYALSDAQASYDTYTGVAGSLWGGLGARLADDPTELRATRAAVGVRTRDVLAPYVLVQLNNADVPGVTNLRDLSNYFLLDVQVGAEPETSPIGSAIASVQLYAHRCVNNLEPDVVLLDEFEQWWQWLANYRVWEANRKVFLFPENYIEPELRHDKTPLFTDLETELQSADLRNPADVNAALYSFLDGLDEVADLVIMGSGGYDYLDAVNTGAVEDGVGKFEGRATKTFCLVGRTREEPYSYYTRTVTFVKGEPNTYVPVRWDPWREFPHSPQPVADTIKPVFAFGKWFLFWVEREQTGQETNEDNSPGEPYYTNYSCASFLDFNREWNGPERRVIATRKNETTSANLQPYPSYSPGAQLITVAFAYEKARLIQFYGNTDGMKLIARFATQGDLYYDSPLNLEFTEDRAGDSIHYYYCLNTLESQNTSTVAAGRDFVFSAWGSLDRYSVKPFVEIQFGEGLRFILQKSKIPLSDKPAFYYQANAADFDDCSGFFECPEGWNRPAVALNRGRTKTFPTDLLPAADEKRSYLSFRRTAFFAAVTDSHKKIRIWSLSETGDTAAPRIEYTLKHDATGRALLVEYAGELYVYWRDKPSKDEVKIGRVDFSRGTIDTPVTLTVDGAVLEITSTPGMTQAETPEGPVLYCAWVKSKNCFLGRLDPRTGELTDQQQLKDSGGNAIASESSPNLAFNAEALDGKAYVYVSFAQKTSGFQMGVYDGKGTVERYGAVQFTDTAPQFDWAPALFYRGELYATWFSGNLYRISWNITDSNWSAQTLFQTTDDFKGDGNAFPLGGQIAFPLHPTDKEAKALELRLLPTISMYLDDRQVLALVLPGDWPGSHAQTKFSIQNARELQDIILYDRRLSTEEIQALYANARRFLNPDFQNASYKLSEHGSITSFDHALDYLLALEDPVTERFTVDQPGWSVCQRFGIRVLTGFQKPDPIAQGFLSCYRLNTTATAALGQALFMGGPEKLLGVSSQLSPELPFSTLNPDPETIPPETWPVDRIDLLAGAMSTYYRELFFFTPFLAASMLKTDRRHAQAKTWYEYIFNPTIDRAHWDLQIEDGPNDRFWRYLGLRAGYNPLLSLELSQTPAEQSTADLQNAAQLFAYHNDPFDPHAVAGLRPIAYQKTIVIHYVHNLIEWGDVLFRQYTRESLGEAFMLYTMAYDLLGKEPVNLGECVLPPVETLAQFVTEYGALQDIPEFLLGLEATLPESAFIGADTPVNNIAGSYFGLPENEDFLGCWSTVQKRLFNISHGLDIDGVRRKAALFEPALNPARLVEQLGNGAGLGEALSAPQTPVPFYRFSVMIQLAKNTTQTVIQYGQALLAALEKKDAEHMALLANQNQLTLLQQTTGSRQAQLDSLKESLAGLEFGLQSARERLDYYTELIDRGLSPGEIIQILLASGAVGTNALAQVPRAVATGLYPLPTVFGLAAGGMSPGDSARQAAEGLESLANSMNMQSSLAATSAGFERRAEEWHFQQNLARIDVDQMLRQIDGMKYQIQAAEAEVKLLQKNIDQEQQVQKILKNKFTNEQLYQWLVGRLSGQYFQLYQIAYEQALQAQQAWRFEKGVELDGRPEGIKGGYWDSLHEGLLAGEALQVNLTQMETAYMQRNKRRFEIEKTISLGRLQPDALLQLRAKGECLFELSEELFDRDYPGHYCRQIASVSVSLPTLIGPYQNIHATLTQLRNSARLEPDLDEKVLRDDWQVNQQIALSQGVNDSGLFTLNFADERYLPFEGTGAVSVWKLTLPKANNPGVDIDNLTDVIVQLNYTALPGPPAFAKEVQEDLSRQG